MTWLVGILVFAIIVALMIASPGFRYFVLISIAAIGVGIYLMIENNNKQTEQRKTEAQRADLVAQSMISVSELEMADITFKRAFHDTWELSGVVTNKSKATLDRVDLTVRLMECARTPCITVGEAAGGFSVTVPPFQARSFTASVRLPNLPPVEQPFYSYDIGTIRGR